MTRTSGHAWLPALIAALASSLCCIVPLFAAVAGVGGIAAGLSWLEPWRPGLIGISIGSLGFAWWSHFRNSGAALVCCDSKLKWWQGRRFLGVVTVVALLLNAFPLYSHMIFARAPMASMEKVTVGHAHIVIGVRGMTCAGCEHHVTEALLTLDGVSHANADHSSAQATLAIDPAHLDTAKITAAIRSIGYEVVHLHMDQWPWTKVK